MKIGIDLLGPVGHVEINKQLIELNELDVWICPDSLAKLYIDLECKIITFSDWYVKELGFVLRIRQIFLIFKLLPHVFKNKVYFYSYDLVSFSLLSWLFVFSDKLFSYEHNTIPKSSEVIKGFFYRKISKKIVRICFEDFIVKHIMDKYFVNSVSVSHPRRIIVGGFLSNYGCDDRIIFAPSGSNDDADIFCCLERKPADINVFVIAKSKLSGRNYFESRAYFDNYDDCLVSSSIVWLPFEFEYRVSGVFYEALSAGKYIVIKKSIFADEMKISYGDKIFVYDSAEEFWVIVSRIFSGFVL